MALWDFFFGPPLPSGDEHAERIGPVTGIGVLGLDALASAAYGPEAALTLLIPLGAAGIAQAGPLLGLIIALLLIVYVSYRQTIAAYPSGGGSYIVARENLGVLPGLVAAAALMLDYVLVVAVGISAGVGALISAVPSLQPHTLGLGLALLALITMVNLRGVRESGLAFLLPTLAFVVLLGGVVADGLVQTWLSGGHPQPVVPPALIPAALTAVATPWLLMQAFASGCTAMTGVEAVSNGVPVFRQPTQKNAQRCLTAIIALLVFLLAGIAALCISYRVAATEPGTAGYQSVLSQMVGAIVGKGWLYAATMASVVGVLALSANTGFADFPRLCQILAQDDHLPRSFASRGRRLVFSNGILLIAVLSAVLLIACGGVTDNLIPLFAVGAFGAFTLSQAGMVVHWHRQGGARLAMLINALGALATGVTLVVVLVAKFTSGAWITLVVIPCCVLLFQQIARHYQDVGQQLRSDAPLSFDSFQPPVVVVPMGGWSRLTQRSLLYAMSLSPGAEVQAVRVALPGPPDPLAQRWNEWVEQPADQAGLPAPRLVELDSPYRRLFAPLLAHIQQLRHDQPHRPVLVVIGELVEQRWYHYFLHNQHAQVLKALLYLQAGEQVVVVSVPWNLR